MNIQLRGEQDSRVVSPESLIAWEQGHARPAMADLEALAAVYDCPVGYFFLEEPPVESTPISFRGLDRSKVSDLSADSLISIERFRFLSRWFANAIAELGMSWTVSIGSAELGESPAEVGRRERNRLGFFPMIRTDWRTPSEAFAWWRRAVEGLGVFVFELKLNPREVRGASLWIGGRYPFILVNRQDDEYAAGRLLSLLHEYAHLITAQDGSVCDLRGMGGGAETFANEVAAKILIQDDEFDQVLATEIKPAQGQEWSDARIDRLRSSLRVSRDVVAILLERRRLAPSGFYRQRRSRWSARSINRGGRSANPLTRTRRVLRDLGTSGAMVISSERAESLSPLDLGAVAGVKVDHLDQVLRELRGSVLRR